MVGSPSRGLESRQKRMSADPKQLERPPWSALTMTHSVFAFGNELARRYPPDIAPMAAIREISDACLHALTALMKPSDVVGLFSARPVPASRDLVVIAHKMVEQMVYEWSEAAPHHRRVCESYPSRRPRDDAPRGIDETGAVLRADDCARILYWHPQRGAIGGNGGRTGAADLSIGLLATATA